MANNNIHLHVHTDASFMKGLQGDGAMSVTNLIDRAIELGSKTMGISDHGNCINWIPFYLKCKDAGINPVLSVEAYVEKKDLFSDLPDMAQKKYRMHELIGSYDYTGYQGLCRFVTATNANKDERGFPCGTLEMLRKEFGPDAKAHGHVFMTTACISGPIAMELSYNRKLDKEIVKAKTQFEKSATLLPDGYDAHKARVDKVLSAKAKADELTQKINFLDPYGKKNCKDVLENPTDYGLKADYEKKDVKEVVASLKEQKKTIMATIDDVRSIVSDSGNKTRYETATRNKLKMEEFEAAKKSKEELIERAKKSLLELIDIFGKENIYAEIQFHGFDGEYEIYRDTITVAKACGVKLIAANDAHMARREDFHKRELMVNLGRISSKQDIIWKPLEEADHELYLKDDDEMRKALAGLDISEADICEAMNSLEEIASRCHLEIPKNPHYPEIPNAKEELRKRCEAGIKRCYPKGFPKKYRERMEYELSVIFKMGYASYFCEVAEFIEYANNSDENSSEIGPGRGSGAGSIVCYLTGITRIDPMRFGLMFERFLNPDRVSLPKVYWAFNVNSITQRCA